MEGSVHRTNEEPVEEIHALERKKVEGGEGKGSIRESVLFFSCPLVLERKDIRVAAWRERERKGNRTDLANGRRAGDPDVDLAGLLESGYEIVKETRNHVRERRAST